MFIQRSHHPSPPRTSSLLTPRKMPPISHGDASRSTYTLTTQKKHQPSHGSHHHAAHHIDPRASPALINPEQPNPRLHLRHDPRGVGVVGALEVAPGAGVGRRPLPCWGKTARPAVLERLAITEIFAVGAGLLDRHPGVVAGAGFEVGGRAHDGGGEWAGRWLEGVGEAVEVEGGEAVRVVCWGIRWRSVMKTARKSQGKCFLVDGGPLTPFK